VLSGIVDAAIITLPLTHPDLHIEELRHDRIVVCLGKEDPLAAKVGVLTSDLQSRLAIFYHPERHPEAHTRLLELLSEAGVSIEEYSRASHPSETQALVKEGYGLALVREGMALEEGLTTRPILGVDWTVDTAVIYHRQRHPKTIPILVRRLKKMILRNQPGESVSPMARQFGETPKLPAKSAEVSSTQLTLYRESS
jgi:DNA-binding transcriptional LysR family regulator